MLEHELPAGFSQAKSVKGKSRIICQTLCRLPGDDENRGDTSPVIECEINTFKFSENTGGFRLKMGITSEGHTNETEGRKNPFKGGKGKIPGKI